MRKQQGFTLVELMIVITIISILAAIVFPAYQDYVARAKITSVINKFSEIKTKLSEYGAIQGKYPRTSILDSLGVHKGGGTYYHSPSARAINDRSLQFVLQLKNINAMANLGSLQYQCSLQKEFTTKCSCSVSSTDLYSVVPSICRHKQTIS